MRSTRISVDAGDCGLPGQLNYGSAGTGTTSHLALELFRSMANISELAKWSRIIKEADVAAH